MYKAIYAIFWGNNFKESWYIRLKNSLINIPRYELIYNFNKSNKKSQKIVSILIILLKSLWQIKRKSIVFYNIPVIKSSIPAITVKYLKSCTIVWDYDDTSFWNDIDFLSYTEISHRKESKLSAQFFETLSFKTADFIIAGSRNIKNFCDFNNKNSILVLNWFDPKVFDESLIKHKNQRREDVKKYFKIKEKNLIIWFTGSIRKMQENDNLFKKFFSKIYTFKNIQFIFMLNGDKEAIDELISFSKKEKIQNVSITWDIFHKDLPWFIAWFDFWLDSTVLTGFEKLDGFQNNSRSGLKVKEFLSLNTPIICWDCWEHRYDLQIAYPKSYWKLLYKNWEECYNFFWLLNFEIVKEIQWEYNIEFRKIFELKEVSKEVLNLI